jgi:hypothetical protein
MTDAKKHIIDFWYEFDLLFNPGFLQTPSDILQAYRFESSLLPNWLIERNKLNIQNYPGNFIEKIKESQDLIASIKLLAENQLKIFNVKLENEEVLQTAFEYFGQGVLFDDLLDERTQLPRRPNEEKVHMMDTLHYGYPRWHVFCRSAVFMGQDPDIWLKIDRLVALAYALHKKLTPQQSGPDGKDPENPEHPDLVQELFPVFTSASFDKLDEHFDNKDVRALLHV